MFEQFRWRGEVIADIKAWAAERGERLVPYHAERVVPSMVTGQMEKEEYDGEMPQSFWGSLLMADGWIYTERR